MPTASSAATAQKTVATTTTTQSVARRLLLLFLLLAGNVFAQPQQPVDGALYLGSSERGRTLLAILHLYPPAEAELTLLEAPLRANEANPEQDAAAAEVASIDLFLSGRYLVHESELEAGTEPWSFIADVAPGGYLDPLGGAKLHLDELPPIAFEAIGTVVLGGIAFADGTFAVQRWAPFFYREPWSALLPNVSLDEIASEGLDQRRQLPESPVGNFTESRAVTVTVLDLDLISYYTTIDTYTGGAHPNTWRESTTVVRGEEGWQEMTHVCPAVRHLGWECNERSLREEVVSDLRRQGAAWVEQGEVTAGTDWLLESFVLTPRGVRFLFDPYAVGPYVQGPFEVDIDYAELAE